MSVLHSDRISLLHDFLLEDILGRLPLQEVVRTSVLSKRWEFLWTQLGKLVFDKSFCSDLIRNDKDRLKLVISDIVFRISKPILELSFSLNALYGCFINQLYVCSNDADYINLEILNHKFCKPSSFDQLHLVKRLTLKSCLVEVPSGFRGFTMLSYIKFYNVAIDGGELSNLVSSCPLLETLILKNLQLCCYLNLFSPNLRFFRCKGFYLDMCLESTPRLQEMMVYVYDNEFDVEEEQDSPAVIVVPFGVIPAIKYVALDGSFLKYMNAGIQHSRCQNNLSHLEVIRLTDVPLELKEVAKNVLSLIRRSPNLEKIMVTTCTEHTASDLGVQVWQTENLSDISLNGLRQAYVLNISTKQSELLFIKVLIAKSPMLETMVFRLHNGISKEEGLRIGEEIHQFRRASSRVEIIFWDPQMKVNFQGYLL